MRNNTILGQGGNLVEVFSGHWTRPSSRGLRLLFRKVLPGTIASSLGT